MTEDALAPLTAACGKCGKAGEPATWCPVWGLRLCPTCRAISTDAELRPARDEAELHLMQNAGIVLWRVCWS